MCYIMILSMVFIVGCTVVDNSEIPNCDTINKTPVECLTYNEIKNRIDVWEGEDFVGDYNISKAKCKRLSYWGPSWEMFGKLEYCFDFMEDNIVTINNTVEEVKYSRTSLFGDDMYCYEDRGASFVEVCDYLIYPNGTNVSVSCRYYDDLVMHFECINITQKNMTVVKNVENRRRR